MDQTLAFTYRKNDGYLNLNAISVYNDLWIKILERLFVNDKQILTDFFKSVYFLRSGGNKSSHILKKACSWKLQVCLSMYELLLPPGLKKLRRFPAYFKFLDIFIEIWIKSGFDAKRKGIPIPGVLPKRLHQCITNSFF